MCGMALIGRSRASSRLLAIIFIVINGIDSQLKRRAL
jgi:hypothetical protein